MYKKLLYQRCKSLLFGLFFISSFGLMFAQNTTSVYLSWDTQLACQIWTENNNGKRYDDQEIDNSECLKVCTESNVIFELHNLPNSVNVTWNMSGGGLQLINNKKVKVSFNGFPGGELSYSYTLNGNTISKSICFEKENAPFADFEILNADNTQQYESCYGENIIFNNLSYATTNAPIATYLWSFGDGNFSYEENPTHTYQAVGEYHVTLEVTNSCGCKSSVEMLIMVRENRVYEINCPGLVCEGQSETYSVSFDAREQCSEFSWDVSGGQIVNDSNGNVQVLWNQVDDSGFGYLTFNPIACEIDCPKPTTIKIPVIQANAVIAGDSQICTDEQKLFALPKWPSTNITWSIINASSGVVVDILQTDQRNEVALQTNAVSGTFTLKAVYQNTLLECGGIATKQITIKPKVVLTLDKTKLCLGDNIFVSNLANIPVSYRLKMSNNQTVATFNNVISQTYTPTQAGKYYFEIVPNTNHCNYDRIWFDVLPKPTLASNNQVSGTNQVCTNIAYQYQISNPNPSFDYVWEIFSGNGSFVGANIGNSISVSWSQLPAQLRVRAYNPNLNCISTVYRSYDVNAIPLAGDVSGSITVCSNSINNYQLNLPNSQTPHNLGDSYEWSLSDNSVGSISNGQGTTNVEIVWNDFVTANQTVTLNVKITKCSLPPVTVSKVINLSDPTPLIAINGPSNPVCANFLNSNAFNNNQLIYNLISNNNVNIANAYVEWRINGQLVPGNNINNALQFINFDTVNQTQLVTAQIINFGICNVKSNIATLDVVVLPNPPVTISVVSGGNAFCTQNEINTTLNIATNATNVSYQWYNENTLLANQTSNTLNVLPAYGFGLYYCVVTNNVTGCIRYSNVIEIIELDCDDNDECIASNGNIQNNSYLSSCSHISLSGSTNGQNPMFSFFGPSLATMDVNQNTITGPPGLYHVFYKADFPCINMQGTKKLSDYKQILIPYKPDIRYEVSCINNNQFAVKFFDNSIVSPLVNNYQAVIAYKPISSSTWTTVVPNQTYQLSSNFYEVKITLSGTSTYHSLPNCEQTITIPLIGVPELTIKYAPLQNLLCHDSPVRFEFNETLLNFTDYDFYWTFEPGVHNKLFNPTRVFSTPGTYAVSVTVINQLNCSKTFTTSIHIPNPCFSGTLVSNPPNAIVCEGNAVQISYVPSNPNATCNPKYRWMHNTTELTQFQNQATISVTQPGYYWLILEDANNSNCRYEVPNRIFPKFPKLPTGRILCNDVYCGFDEIEVKVSTSPNVTYYIYTSDYFYYADGNNQSLVFQPYQPGTYQILVDLTDTTTGCTNTIQRDITVVETPEANDITLTSTFNDCSPYQVTLNAHHPTATHYLWSNGAAGSSIQVMHGGVYQVTVFVGECSATKTISVPRHPSEYAWSYPTGCLGVCNQRALQVLGPIVDLPQILWDQINGANINTHILEDSPLSDLPSDGFYHATLTNNGCNYTTLPFAYQLNNCNEKCDFEYGFYENTTMPSENSASPFCDYHYIFEAFNNYNDPITVTLTETNNQMLITPAVVTLLPGNNLMNVQFIPFGSLLNPLTTSITLSGVITDSDFNQSNCLSVASDIVLQPCNSQRMQATQGAEKSVLQNKPIELLLYPNPAQDILYVQADNSYHKLTVYDLQGKLLINHFSNQQTLQSLDVSKLASGVYVVVVSQADGMVTHQYKFIKK
ncbi:MAG: PKD domain-containing protein [Flavobacteriales bacterium]|nr:PKD domain-containing protein [Flavobacteriales bacterium]